MRDTLEPLLRMATTSLQSADQRISAIQGEVGANQKHAGSLESAHKRIAEAIKSLNTWAEANRVEIRSSMKT